MVTRAGGAGAAGAALAAPLLNSNIISSMGRGSAEPPKILLPYLQWPPHFSWASDAPDGDHTSSIFLDSPIFLPNLEMSRIFCVHIMTIYGNVQFFLKNVCYIQDFFGKVQVLSKNHLITLSIIQSKQVYLF